MSLSLDRRGFLKGAATAGLGAAAQAFGLTAFERSALAQNVACSTTGNGVWGDLVGSIVGNTGAWTCGTLQGKKILEIYCQGGAPSWEPFWLSGLTTNNDFSDHFLNASTLGLSGVDWATNAANTTANFQSECHRADIPTTSNWYSPFATQATGEQIYWGAPAKPLWSRPDILNRCRMVTMVSQPPGSSYLTPHEAAVPYCLTGLTLGNPRIAGTSAAVQHRVRELEMALGQQAALPACYVLYNWAPLAPSALAATGEHPGYTRPVVIQVKSNNDFYNNLARQNITKPEADDLFLALRHEYRDRMIYQGAGSSTVRSAGFDSYWAAAELLGNAPALQSLFANNLLVIDQNVKICPTYTGVAPGFTPGTKTMIKTAASLLSSTGPARYVCVVDSGLTRDYDTHGDAAHPYSHVLSTSANFYDTLKHLADNIYDAAANPTGLLNLADTMVVITTEFGRSNDIVNTGREHHPEGFVTVLIGGHLPATGPTIGGAIDSSGNTVSGYKYSPTDLRGAMLLSAGIDPFAAPGNFREPDFSPALLGNTNGTQAQIRNKLKELILGL